MNLNEKYGQYALVTGASSGLGLAFAEYLAAHKMDLVLVARREAELKLITNRLQSDYSVTIIPITQDLSDPGFMDNIESKIKDLDIGLLINNAGIGASGEFTTIDLKRHMELVRLNCQAPVQLSHYILSGMKKRKRGAVIFLGSIVGHGGTPFYSTYAASKAFNISLAKSIWFDVRSYNIDVLAISPGTIKTDFHRNAGMSQPRMAMLPAQVVMGAMQKLGKSIEYVPGTLNRFLSFFNDLFNGAWYYQKKYNYIKKNMFEKNGEPEA